MALIDSDDEPEKGEEKEDFEPLYESHIIQETPDLKPVKRRRIKRIEIQDSEDEAGGNYGNNGKNGANLDSTLDGSDDEFKPDEKKMAGEKAWKPKKQKRLFQNLSDSDELGILTGAASNGFASSGLSNVSNVSKSDLISGPKIDHLRKRVPGYEDEFYNDILTGAEFDVVKAERHLRQMMARGDVSPKKTSSSENGSPLKKASSSGSGSSKFPKLKSVKTAFRPSSNGFSSSSVKNGFSSSSSSVVKNGFSSSSSSVKNGFTPVLKKPDEEFIAENHKRSIVSRPDLLSCSESDDDVTPLPSTSSGRTKLPRFGAKDTKSFYFSSKSTLQAKPVTGKELALKMKEKVPKEKVPKERREKQKAPKQKRRFMTKRDLCGEEEEDSDDSFINDDSEEILSTEEGVDVREKGKKKRKKGPSGKRRKEETDELVDLLDSSGSDADVDENRIILTSDEDDSDEESAEESEGGRKTDEESEGGRRKSRKKEKQCTLQERVWIFMQTGSLCDLISIPGVSRKKGEVILSLRPFTDYGDFVSKVRRTKGLTTEVVNAALSAVKSRDVVHRLMGDCESISTSISAMVCELKEAKQPTLLNPLCTLKQYQMIGLNWLLLMHKKGINAILADEMGLGKTIQVIALLAHLREHFNISGPHCIVVPASTRDNWDRELSTWCPDIDVLVYHGTQGERAELRERIGRDEISYDVILTTYNMLFSDDDKKLFKRKVFEYIIFDEAHMLKNMKTTRYAKLLRIESKHRLLLTGTPLQNNLLELMSLLMFTMPDLFRGREGHVQNMFTFSAGGAPGLDKSTYEQERIDHAKKIMKPFILRRLKDDVLKQLPTKTIIVRMCPMTASQEKKYKRMIASYQDEIRKDDSIIEDIDIDPDVTIIETPSDRIGGLEGSPKKAGGSSQNCEVSSKSSSKKEPKTEGRRGKSDLNVSKESKESDEEDQKRRKAGAAMLMNLRKGANHPLLNRMYYNSSKLRQMARLMLEESTHRDANPDLIFEDMELHSDFELHQLCVKYPSLNPFKLPCAVILDSGKLRVLDHLLPQLKEEGKRVLIFSQFVMVLDILESYLQISQYRYTRLDGSTRISDRLDLIDQFNHPHSDIFIFLLTTRAGGVGINLTAASVAIIHDIDFNPYNDKQAEDRCHRVGQMNDVTVYKLITADSIEEGMLAIAENKLKLGQDLCGNEKKGEF